jgi:cell division septum initiation protein DivIVA
LKVIFVTLIFLITLPAFSLPGEPPFGEHEVIGACQAHVGVLEGSVLAEFVRIAGCEKFKEDETLEYCECISKIAGDEIRSNSEYQEFKERVGRFDRQETAKARFVNQPRTIQLASLANLLAEMDPSLGNPFDNGGKCEAQLKELETSLNEGAAIKHNLADISMLLKQQKNVETLNTRGINGESMRDFLNSVLILSSNAETGDSYLQTTEPSENDFFKLVQESLEVPVGETSIRVRMSERLGSNSGSSQVSPSDAMDALCANIAQSYKRETEVNDVEKVVGRYIDVNAYITQKVLSPIDIEAFRGLKYLYSTTDSYDAERDGLFFGQMMCESIDPNLFRDAEPAEEEEIRALSNDELKEGIVEGNSFLRNVSKEYEAAYQKGQELEQGLENFFAEIAGATGVEKERVQNAIKELDPDNPSYVEAAIALLGEGDPKVPELSAYLQEYHRKEIEFKNNEEKIANFMILHYEKQMEVDHMFQELASRFDGSVERAADFIGMKELRSHSIRYFSSFDYNATGNQGPPMPTHMALNAGEISGFTGDTLVELERSHHLDATRTADVTAEIFENGSKFIKETPGLTRALVAIEKGTTSKEVSSPVSRAIYTSTGGNTEGKKFVPPAMTGGRQNGIGTNVVGTPVKRVLTNEEKAIMAQKEALLGGSGTGGGTVTTTDLGMGVGQGKTFTAADITNDTDFGQFLPNIAPNRVESPSSSALETGIESLESHLKRLREKRESESNTDDGEPDPLDDEIKKLTAEIEALRKEKDRIDQENEEARKKLRERERISSTLTDQPAGRTIASEDVPVTRNIARARAQTTAGRTEETGGFTGRGAGAPVVAVVESTGGGAIVDSAPSAYSRRPVIPRDSGDGSSKVTLNREMTLVSGSMGFIELSATEIGNLAVEPISVNFLSLSRVEQAEFMRRFFDGRPGAQAYVKQADGKVVLLNKNESYAGLTTTAANEDPVVTLDLNERHLAEQSLQTVYRLQQLDAILAGETE